ncbi:hypothetical protein BDR26DRAFT_902888 [Obelidium mucronatum]|nr:hypothetical protein BDR26DRAFT_902888 [Obelidium mucronatum]
MYDASSEYKEYYPPKILPKTRTCGRKWPHCRLARREAKLALEAQLEPVAFSANQTWQEIEIELFGSIISDDETEKLPLAIGSTMLPFKTHLWSAWLSADYTEFLNQAKLNTALWSRMLEGIKSYLLDKLDADQLSFCRVYVKSAPALSNMMIPDAFREDYLAWFRERVQDGFGSKSLLI